MKIDNYEVTLIDGDISIMGDEFHYATLNNGKIVGLQCNYNEGTPEYDGLLEKLYKIYDLFIEVDKTIK